MSSKPIKELSYDLSAIFKNRNIKIGILSPTENMRKEAKNEPSKTGKRGTTNKVSEMGNANVLEIMEMRYNILSNPFVNKYTKNTKKEIDKYVSVLAKNELTGEDVRKMENGLKSLFVSSILNSSTGKNNSPETVKKKGFDKFGYDTGQLVKNILVEVKK
jgi:hypothetical protein